MSNILLIISIILTLICYILIFISSLTSKNGSETAYEAVIRLTKEDNGLRLVESKDNILNKYQLKRKIIKLKEKTYSSKSYFSLSIAYLLSGYSKLKESSLEYLSKVIPYFYYLSFTPIISLVITLVIKTSLDAKIGIIIFIIILIYQNILSNLNTKAIDLVKDDNKYITKYLNNIIFISKVFILSTIIQLIRMIILL